MEKNNQEMETEGMTVKYEKFAALLLEEKVYRYGYVTFRRLCRWVGAAPGAMNSLLENELGTGGRTLLRKLRK